MDKIHIEFASNILKREGYGDYSRPILIEMIENNHDWNRVQFYGRYAILLPVCNTCKQYKDELFCCGNCRDTLGHHKGNFASLIQRGLMTEEWVKVLYENYTEETELTTNPEGKDFKTKFGFWQRGKGCILPREFRSVTCLTYHCNLDTDKTKHYYNFGHRNISIDLYNEMICALFHCSLSSRPCKPIPEPNNTNKPKPNKVAVDYLQNKTEISDTETFEPE